MFALGGAIFKVNPPTQGVIHEFGHRSGGSVAVAAGNLDDPVLTVVVVQVTILVSNQITRRVVVDHIARLGLVQGIDLGGGQGSLEDQRIFKPDNPLNL